MLNFHYKVIEIDDFNLRLVSNAQYMDNQGINDSVAHKHFICTTIQCLQFLHDLYLT